jgi:predicted DNA-binding transcriptional regulator AlpA
MANIEARLLPIPAAMQRIGVRSKSTFYELVNSGQLSMRKLGGKSLVEVSEIERFIDALPKVGGAKAA